MSRDRPIPALSPLALVAITVAALATAGCGQVPTPASPAVFELAPTRVRAGDALTLDGQGFGALEGGGFVTVHGTPAAATTWSDTRITVTVPAVVAGATVAVVSQGGRTSPPVDLTVLPGS